MSHKDFPNIVKGRSYVRQPAKPVRWTSGLLTGSSIDILPWNLAWPFLFSEDDGLGSVDGGIQSRFEVEKPPMSLSDMTLQLLISSALWKSLRGKGLVARDMPSALNAVELGQYILENLARFWGN